MVTWEELPESQKKALQKPRHLLTKEEKKLRKQLFWSGGWVDAYGHRHQAQERRGKKREKK